MKRVTMKCLLVALLLTGLFIPPTSAEVVLQWFGTTWTEMTEKMPILAELGYGSIYTPVPNKAGSIWSVGYDVYDRFDLGHLERNGIATQYGTMQELLVMVETAHRFGIRVYFDNVMNHNAYLAPGESDEVDIDYYPDMAPEDFHVIKDGYYYEPSGDIEGWMYDSGFHEGVQHYRLSGLLDIANESGSLGYNWDQPDQPVHSYIRQPDEPDKYPDRTQTPVSSGGIDIYPFNGTNGTPVSEDVNAYLNRAARWLMDVTGCDGFRFDAAKHVYPAFFGSQDDDFAGYCGAIQAQYNLTHGMTDSNNRDSTFSVDRPRDDALLFAECVPHTNFDAYDYTSRGTRLLDFYYEGILSGVFYSDNDSFGYGDMTELLNLSTLGQANGVIQSQNHDHEQHADLDMMYQYALLRNGIPLVYTDGNHHALADEDGRAFPTYGRGDFLGQYQNPALTDMLDDIITRPGPQSEISRAIWIHEQFSRGELWNKVADSAVLVNERVQTWDYDREQSYDQNEGTILLSGFCDNKDEWGAVRLGPWAEGIFADCYTDFRPGTLLFNYGTVLDGMSPLAFTRVESDWRINLEVPPGHYVAYSMMVPGRSHPSYAPEGMDPILVQQLDGGGTNLAGTMTSYRTDTPQGDGDWDNDGIPNEEDPVTVPRISGDEDLRFVSISDGLTATAMVKIDGGIDVNGDGLDHPPGEATDVFLGYEPMNCLHKRHLGNNWYFYKHDHAEGEADDLYWAITSDMDSDTTNDISDAGSDFSTRSEYDAEYDATVSATNFSEGYHIARTRVFRKRAGGPNDGADIFNTFKQTFYVDRELPTGAFAYPRSGETLWSSEYGMVFRTDDTVTRVEVHIVDEDATNDDDVLGAENGNGTATNGSGDAWAEATRVSPYPANLVTDPDTTNAYEQFPREWKFTYRNIPSSGNATITIKLYEDSSESFPSHVTVLSSTHGCQAPAYQLQFEYPRDGDSLSWTDYNIVFKFSDTLPQDADRVSLLIDNVFVPRDDLNFYDSGGGYHWMSYAWSNYNRGTHNLSVYYSAGWPNDHELEASVNVEATEAISFVLFTQPQAVDNNGQTTVIKLPVPVPSTATTNYPVLLETSDDVQTLHLRISDTSRTNFPWEADATPISTNLDRITWTYNWEVTTNHVGSHKLIAEADTDGNTSVYEVSTAVHPRLEFWQLVDENDSDSDDDDDGIPDGWNTTNAPGEAYAYHLTTDKPDADTWNNGDIHQYFFSGKTDPLTPDTDNDGLPDGLELGIGGAFDAGTDTATDSDGDGYPNFLGDQDPPIYNSWYNKLDEGYPYLDGENQLQVIMGSVTDPSNSDTDSDGQPDGVEDENRNGRWDWPDETDPNNPDTEEDGLLDGSEDSNHDGDIAGDTNGNRIYDAGEAWTETDPLTADTDGDGMPDGWEQSYGLDPLDNGTDSFRTATADDGLADNGATGDPDGDLSLNGDEYTNDSNPMFDETATEISSRAIHIGPGPALGTLGGEEYFEMFSDWEASDCHKLDAADDCVGIGSKSDSAYSAQAEDGYATSRDLIAFYSRDGGSEQGSYYFRIDVQDLQYQAEEGYVDFYVAIKLGDPDSGSAKAFPDDLNTSAEHGWDVLVGIYETGIGAVYVGDAGSGNAYFQNSHFRADYDSVEVAISRQALLDAGWNGFSDLNYQVFTVKDGTCDTCGSDGGPGDGDIGGQGDITDAFLDDARGWDGELSGYVSSDWTINRAKTALLMHASRSADPASSIQELLYNDATSPAVGYHRHPAAHTFFDRPSSLHISGVLASAIQWAQSDSNTNKDGVAFNETLASEIREGRLGLMPGPYADVSLPYLSGEAIEDSIQTGQDVLEAIYQVELPNWWDVFWIPNQITDGATLEELVSQGIYFTVIDQWTHLFNWFDRQSAISSDGYAIQEINGMKCFAISQAASDELFEQHDGGLSMTLRNLLHTKALEGWTDAQQAQVIVLRGEWSAFSDTNNAGAYDHNLDWIVNHPWIQLVTLEEIAKGEIDVTGDGEGDHWPTINHGTGIVLTDVQSTPFIHFASEGSYNYWYNGSDNEEALFGWRGLLEGTNTLPYQFGHTLVANTLLYNTWQQLEQAGSGNIGNLGRMVFAAALQQTAWHDEDATDDTRWSDGTYIHPDTTYDYLASWAKVAHAHVREAGLYGLIEAWSLNPPDAVVRMSLDVDSDGELESVLYNNRIYAVMEDNGGRLTAAFARDPDTALAVQVIGSPLAFPDSEGEEEGTANVTNGEADARRTSALKDWWAGGSATADYINDLYTPASITDGWQFTSSDSMIVKSVSLSGADSDTLDVAYTVDASLGTQYIRCGLSPNLYDLALHGQRNLSDLVFSGSTASLTNNDYSTTVSARLTLGSGASFQTTAVDHEGTFASRTMRNQAFCQQVELYGAGDFSFQLSLSADQTDTDNDGTPNDTDTDDDGDGFSDDIENMIDPLTGLSQSDPVASNSVPIITVHGITRAEDPDDDGDGMTDLHEVIAGTDPHDVASLLRFMDVSSASGTFQIEWSTIGGRNYTIEYRDLREGSEWQPLPDTSFPIWEDGVDGEEATEELEHPDLFDDYPFCWFRIIVRKAED